MSEKTPHPDVSVMAYQHFFHAFVSRRP